MYLLFYELNLRECKVKFKKFDNNYYDSVFISVFIYKTAIGKL